MVCQQVQHTVFTVPMKVVVVDLDDSYEKKDPGLVSTVGRCGGSFTQVLHKCSRLIRRRSSISPWSRDTMEKLPSSILHVREK